MNTVRKILVYFLLVVTIGLIGYTLFIYNFTLSDGVRSGVLSKFSNKGVIFKTWEGELNEGFGATRFFPFSVEDGEEKVIEDFNFDTPKTKNFVDVLKALELDTKKSLFVLGDENANVYISSRNLKNSKVIKASEINTYGVLNANKVVITEGSLEGINTNLSK